MQLYLIRHAESENNAKPEHLRQEDPPLSATGRRQAECLAQWTRSLKMDVLITSPFLRTLQTTRMVVEATSQQVHVWHDVFERGGCYPGHGPDAKQGASGLGRSQIRQQACDDERKCVIDDTIGEDGWWSGRDRESDEQAVLRASVVTERLRATFGNSDKHVVAVIHADLKRLMLAEMLRPNIDPLHLGPLRNTGITKLDYNGSRWTLDWFNSVSHLPGPLVGSGEGV